MHIDRIVHIDDLLRNEFLPARGFIYGCIAEPLRQAFSTSVPNPSHFPAERGLDASFEHSHFLQLCAVSWRAGYRNIPVAAQEYLLSHIPPDALVIGYEMPPWLRNLLDAARIWRIDLRISPLRFARDLVLAVDAKTPGAIAIDEWSSRIERKVRIDAGLMRAAVQHNTPNDPSLPGGESRVVFVGQTESDASLIDDLGRVVRIEDYADKLRSFVGTREIGYARHPYAGNYGKTERHRLSRLIGRNVDQEERSLYDLMASRERIFFISLSSGAIQEAAYFEQDAEFLFRAVCPMSRNGSPGYRFATFSDVTSPEYWRACMTGASYAGFDGPMPENLMRRLHNIWWGYSDFYIDNDAFWRKVVTRGLKNVTKRILRR